jgi:carboxymethylenebutenolidase
MGGGLTLQAAARATSNVDAVHAYYSAPTPSPEEAAAIRVPVMGSYGTEDELNPVDQVEAMRDALEQRGAESDIKIYEGAGHSFFNSGPAHHEPSAQDSWQRSLEWFGRHLS